MNRLRGKSPTGMFSSRTLGASLIRGAVGLALLGAAIGQQRAHPDWSMLAALLALVALRGCPVCWLIGLVETVRQRAR